MKNELDRLIILVGPTLVGKTAIAKNLASILGVEQINTEGLCEGYNYIDKEDGEALIKTMKKWIESRNISILDLSGNVAELCLRETVEDMYNKLTINNNPPEIYMILPDKNKDKSLSFLVSMAKKLKMDEDSILRDVVQSLMTPNFNNLKVNPVYTLSGVKFPKLMSKSSYLSHLNTVSENLAEEIMQKYSDIKNKD